MPKKNIFVKRIVLGLSVVPYLERLRECGLSTFLSRLEGLFETTDLGSSFDSGRACKLDFSAFADLCSEVVSGLFLTFYKNASY